MNKKILLIITGSVACYKSIELIRLLKKKKYEVTCILSKGAKEFITQLMVSSISGNKTYDELFNVEDEINMGHINLSRTHDLILIAPASADFIAKIANGYGDDLALAVILASNKKIIFAPAMNEKMWLNSITQQNIDKIIHCGLKMINPESDILACGEEGIGKMASLENIIKEVDDFFIKQNLFKDINILITAGATVEPIDPVRFIGNNSSGKQALAIAKILSEMGANIYLVIGNIKEKIDFACKTIIEIKTAKEMLEEVMKLVNSIDIFIGCSAVSDYKVKNFSPTKIKKSDNPTLILELEKNPDILLNVSNSENRPKIVIGFCAENENLFNYANEKLIKKNCDLIIANNVNHGEIFGSDFTDAMMIQKNSCQKLGRITKAELAYKLALKIKELLGDKNTI